MKKALLLPIAIAISSKVYASSKLVTFGTFLLMATSVIGDPAVTHNALTQSFGGGIPSQQMGYLKTLPLGCSTASEDLLNTAHEKTFQKAAATCKWDTPYGL